MTIRPFAELQAEVDVLMKATDEQIASMYECEVADATDMRDNHMENLEAERLEAGYPVFTFPCLY